MGWSANGRGCVKSLGSGNAFNVVSCEERGRFNDGLRTGADPDAGNNVPARLEDYVAEDDPVRVIGFFVDQLDLAKLGFGGVRPKETGRPAYHPAVMLKIYVYGYLNRVQSSRRLEPAGMPAQCRGDAGCLAPDFKTIADFRKDNGPAIRKVCREFIVVCGRAGLLAATMVAIDGSKFKAVNSRDRNFTQTKVAKRLEQLEASIERYLAELETADRQPSTPEVKINRLKDKVGRLKRRNRAHESHRGAAGKGGRHADFAHRSRCPLNAGKGQSHGNRWL